MITTVIVFLEVTRLQEEAKKMAETWKRGLEVNAKKKTRMREKLREYVDEGRPKRRKNRSGTAISMASSVDPLKLQ